MKGSFTVQDRPKVRKVRAREELDVTRDTDQLRFLASIRDNPDCDTARLAYADWLCEHGDSTDNRDRAELIRAQVRLPICKATPGEDAGWEFTKLKAREHQLITAHPDWLPKCPRCNGGGTHFDDDYAGNLLCVVCSGTGHIGEFRRGLLECVRVPTMATVWEQHVEEPGGDGVWKPTAWAHTHLAPHLATVAEVWCGDKAPLFDAGAYFYDWYNADHPKLPTDVPDSARLPEFLFRRLKNHEKMLRMAVSKAYGDRGPADLALAKVVADSLREVLK